MLYTTRNVLDQNQLDKINTRILEGETCCLDDREGVGYMLNSILEVLPQEVRSLSFQGVTVTRTGSKDWTFRMAMAYITKNYL